MWVGPWRSVWFGPHLSAAQASKQPSPSTYICNFIYDAFIFCFPLLRPEWNMRVALRGTPWPVCPCLLVICCKNRNFSARKKKKRRGPESWSLQAARGAAIPHRRPGWSRPAAGSPRTWSPSRRAVPRARPPLSPRLSLDVGPLLPTCLPSRLTVVHNWAALAFCDSGDRS